MHKIAQLTKQLAETVCDQLCKYPCICNNQKELDECCENCPMQKQIDALNELQGLVDLFAETSNKYYELKARLKKEGYNPWQE